MALQYGRVTFKITRESADQATDGDSLPDSRPVRGYVYFRPSRQVTYDAGSGEMKVIDSVAAGLDSLGVLRNGQGDSFVALISPESPDLSHQGWTWEASFRLFDAPSVGPFPFTLSPGEVKDLGEYAPVHVSRGVAIIRGPAGPASPGTPGASAYDVAVENGFTGTQQEWLASLIGPQGVSGLDDAGVAFLINDPNSAIRQALDALYGSATRLVIEPDDAQLVVSPTEPTSPTAGTVHWRNG